MATKGAGGIATVSLDPFLEAFFVENVATRSLPFFPHKVVFVTANAALFRISGLHVL